MGALNSGSRVGSEMGKEAAVGWGVIVLVV